MKNETKIKNEPGIYKILNLVNNKVYIGSSIHLARRCSEHIVRYTSPNNKEPVNKYLKRAFNKYGADNFEFHAIEYCDLEKLIEREQYYMDLYNSYNRKYGYNLRTKADSNRDYRPSEETKRKISISNLGQTRSEETREKLRNRIITNETRANMSIGAKNKNLSDVAKLERDALLLSYSSRPKSEETKRKISESLKLRNAKKWELTEPPINV